MTTEVNRLNENPSILVVDDSTANLELLTGILRKNGYEARPALNGKLALLAAKTEPPELILLDINMPEMNGFEVLACLKSDEALKDIPVILITGLAEPEDIVKAFSMGAVDYVTKPFHLEEIEARIKTQMNIRSMQCRLSDQNKELGKLVEERTRELENAYIQLKELDRLKDSLMHMISHEIRTPSNGVLGVGNLILDLCPASEEHTMYADLFEKSSLRLNNLINDITMICDMENLSMKKKEASSFSQLLCKLRSSLPRIKISVDKPLFPQEADLILGSDALLGKAMETIVLLASAFSIDKDSVRMKVTLEPGLLCLQLDLDAFSLAEKDIACFFQIESPARASSAAESLGLSPVVAHKFISSIGGDLRFVKLEGNKGYLLAKLANKMKDELPLK